MLLSIHEMLAAGLAEPRWKLEPAEAKTLREATERVARHYGSFGVPEKIMDHVALVMAIGQIYGTRAFVIMSEKRHPPSPEPVDNDVTILHPGTSHVSDWMPPVNASPQ